MLDITIPMWVLLSVAGLPTMILLMLSIRLMRIKRYKNRVLAQQAPEAAMQGLPREGFGQQMDSMILEQQIDSVFSALVTILETERIKLKALVCRNQGEVSPAAYNAIFNSRFDHREDRHEESVTAVSRPKEEPRSVAQLVAEGSAPEEIARRLGLSQTEVALAMKIHGGRRGQRLEAVA